MSRSGYDDGCDDHWGLIRWRGAVASAIRGKRGQAFLNELLAAMDALPEKKLIANDLEAEDGAVCAIGSVGKARGIAMKGVDPEDNERVASLFGIPHTLACEIVYMNDEWGRNNETPAQRFERMRLWAKRAIWDARGCVDNPYSERADGFGAHPLLHWNAVIPLNEV